MEIKIKNLGMNGEGVGEIDGKIVFVPGTIQDEIVDCSIVKDCKNYCYAKPDKLIQKSVHRVSPPCPYFDVCGGCDLQHIDYDWQLNFKTNLVKNTLQKVANISYPVNNTIGCKNQYNYRNKISFSCNTSVIGFKQKSSNQLIDATQCLLADNQINIVINLIRQYLTIKPIRTIKNIVVRHLNNQTLIAIVCKQKEDLSILYNYLQQHLNNLFGLFLVINSRNDSVVLTDHIVHIGGLKNINLTDNLNLTLDINSFYQTNLDIQNKLYNYVLEQISTDEIVVNGYSGAGFLSAMLAKKAKHVYGIEINKSAHKDAENLKKYNKINNLTNICGDFFKNYQILINKNKFESVSTMVLDPSKKGCGKQVMKAIDGINKIVYISCNPIALAKDLREIIENYNIVSIQPFDMFPNTVSVETCIVLQKK